MVFLRKLTRALLASLLGVFTVNGSVFADGLYVTEFGDWGTVVGKCSTNRILFLGANIGWPAMIARRI